MFQFSATSHISDVGFSGLLVQHGTEREEQKLSFTYMTHFKLIYVCVLRSLCVCMCAWGYVCVHVSFPLVGVYILNQPLRTGKVFSQGCQCVKGPENARSVLWEYVSQFNCSYRFIMSEGSMREGQKDIRAQL